MIGLDMADCTGVFADLAEEQDSVLSFHMVAHNQLQFQFQGICCAPLARHMTGTDTYRQATHMHKINVF